MKQFPFKHDSRIHLITDERFQIAYYARGYLKYKRVRDIRRQAWKDTIEEEVDSDSFWMVVACIERAKFCSRR